MSHWGIELSTEDNNFFRIMEVGWDCCKVSEEAAGHAHYSLTSLQPKKRRSQRSRGQRVQGMLNGPDGRITPWTKNSPLRLLGHCPDLQTNTQGTNLFPLISCLAQQLRPWISVSVSCLFRTVAFLSNFCVRREEAEGPGAEWRDGVVAVQRTEGLNRVFQEGQKIDFFFKQPLGNPEA